MKDEILEKIKELFGDTSQEPYETREQLEEIKDEINILLEALDA